MIHKRKKNEQNPKLFFEKDAIKRMKKQATDGEKLFANHIFCKVFIHRKHTWFFQWSCMDLRVGTIKKAER